MIETYGISCNILMLRNNLVGKIIKNEYIDYWCTPQDKICDNYYYIFSVFIIIHLKI